MYIYIYIYTYIYIYIHYVPSSCSVDACYTELNRTEGRTVGSRIGPERGFG